MAGKKAAKKSAAKKTAHKAAKHAAKHALKKAAAKGPAHSEGRDLRRAYEHMGRLEALRPLLAEDAAANIEVLLRFAQSSLAAEDFRSAAELLRAGEHLGFGSLAAEERDGHAEDRLRREGRAECGHLLQRAEEHWERHGSERAWPLDETYAHARKQAEQALKREALRRALEFARAAEAMGHVRGAAVALSGGKPRRQLRP